MSTETVVLGAILTALVIVLQLVGTFTAFFGPFSTALALIPIAIGAIMCGPFIGMWLGFVFGVVVIVTGGAALFFAYSVPGTVITVLLKGAACGFVSGLVYKLLGKWNRIVGAITAAIICPVVNTAVFLLGGAIFFLPHSEAIAAEQGMAVTGMALFWAFAMANFIFEVGLCTVLSPVIVRILNIRKKEGK